MPKIYFDYAATTPIDPRVAKEMASYVKGKFGNTMSLHSFGQEAKFVLEKSREKVAAVIKAKPNEIIFTGSATESNNLALKGIAFAAFSNAMVGQENQRSREFPTDHLGKKKHIIISQIEHPCVAESVDWLEKHGFEITRLPVDKYGLVNYLDIEKAIKQETILVSTIHGSNEIGTIQPIEEIGKICREKNVYFHTDASQCLGKIPIDVNKMNIDLLTASSHKIYGPKGAALLFIRNGVKIEPILHGGGQERGLRSSTINLAAIVGFAKACEICDKEMKKEAERLEKLRNILIKEVITIKESYLNGHPEKRLPNIINFRFSFIEGESLAIQLDLKGVAVSTGSACSSIKLEPSPILLAIGLSPQEAHGSLRISLGRWTTKKEIDYLLEVLPGIVENLRKISPFKG